MIKAILQKLLWGVIVLGALAVLLRGLWAGVYFEPTGEAIAEARWGRVLVGIACSVLVAAAVYAVLVLGWPRWVGGGLLTPVLLCGGLTLFASETLLPQLAVLVAYPAALVGWAGGLIAGGRDFQSSAAARRSSRLHSDRKAAVEDASAHRGDSSRSR